MGATRYLFLTLACLSLARAAPECRGPAHLLLAVQSNPSARTHSQLAKWYEERRLFDCALQSFRSASEAAPNSARALENVAVTLRSLKRRREAAEILIQAIALDPDDVRLRFSLAEALYADGDSAAAIDALRGAVRTAPNSAQAHLSLGIVLAREGRAAEARNSLLRALELDPRSEAARQELAALDEPSRSAEADAAARYRQAVELIRNDFLAEAATELRALLGRQPAFVPALINLGVVEQRLGSPEAAEPLFRRAIELAPNALEARVNLGLTLASLERFAEAEDVLERAREDAPDQPTVLSALGMVLTRLQRFDDAISVFERLVELAPRSAEARLNLGNVLADRSRQQEALPHLEQAVKLAPSSAPAKYSLGRALHELHRERDAREMLQAACRLDPGHAAAHVALGVTENELGLHAEAAAALDRALEIAPDDPVALRESSRVMMALGERESALARLKRSIEIDPTNAQSRFLLTRLLFALGLKGEARVEGDGLRRLKAEEARSSRARVLSNFALDAVKKQDWEEAAARLDEAITLCGDCPVIAVLRKNLGLVKAHAGDQAGAVAELTSAIELAPDDQDARYALRILQGADSSNGR